VAMVNGEGRQLLRGVLHVEEGIRKPTWHKKGGEWRSAQRVTEKGSQRRCSTGATVLQRLGDGFCQVPRCGISLGPMHGSGEQVRWFGDGDRYGEK
jgi:hypothetical protein